MGFVTVLMTRIWKVGEKLKVGDTNPHLAENRRKTELVLTISRARGESRRTYTNKGVNLKKNQNIAFACGQEAGRALQVGSCLMLPVGFPCLPGLISGCPESKRQGWPEWRVCHCTFLPVKGKQGRSSTFLHPKFIQCQAQLMCCFF